LASRAQDYFRTSINVEIEIAGLVRLHDTHIAADPVQIERGLRRVANANYIFAGPGSPTYALRQWSGSPIASIITGKLQTGGIVTFASAAALTLGKATVPVYEVYKVGQDVERLDGLDILSSIGINAAVIPHYDNAEGGNHDTRFCYLGEKRLELFETMLDNDTYVLGVDEHTGLIIDIASQEATVVGNGGVTLRLRSQSFVYPTGSVLPFSLLQNPFQLPDPGSSATSNKTARIASTESPVQDAPTKSAPSSLDQSLQQASQEFEEAMKNRNAEGAVRAALALEQAIVDWKADTLQGDVSDRCRATLRSMMSQLGDAAVSGVRDPREVVSPYIEAMLAVRAIVRAEKRFDLSDIIRDAFASLSIEVRDTPQGAEWSLPAE
jgi:hypothetical protein